MLKARPLAFAQLLRLPNVFTAFADICLAASAAGYITSRPHTFALLLGASGLLYLAGMGWNDFFDRRDDARTRPARPLPTGRIRPLTAAVLSGVLMLLGIALAGFAVQFQWSAMIVPAALAALILLYDGVLKHYWVGPLGMGGCRFLNVLLGCLSFMPAGSSPLLPWHLAGVVGLYIVGVTWFARTEERESNRWQLVAAAAVTAVAVLLAVALPVHFEPGRVPFYFPYLLVAFAFVVGFPVVAAIRSPTPRNVQAAVKRCILGLVLLDAALATAFVGWPGLFIALLVLPALWLGRWVYST